MSHIATYKSTIGNVNIDLLKKALEVFALENNLEIKDFIKDYYGTDHKVWEGNKIIGSFFTKTLSRGMGIAVDKNGHLIFIGEDFGQEGPFKKMRAKLEQTYKIVVLLTALQKMGYEISDLREGEKMTAFEGNNARKKIAVGMDDKGNITTDFGGFAGRDCFDEAIKLTEKLKELGVNVDAQSVEPKSGSPIERPEKQRQTE